MIMRKRGDKLSGDERLTYKPAHVNQYGPREGTHGMSSRCVCARHIECSDDLCGCICHSDPVLIAHFRQLYRKREAA